MIPDGMVDAAARSWLKIYDVPSNVLSSEDLLDDMRAALEAAGVGELVEMARWYASHDAHYTRRDYGLRACAVLEKLGMSEANASNELKASEKE